MSKVTSKLQVTIPKAIAQAHGIRPGTEIAFESAGEAIRITLVTEPPAAGANEDLDWRLRLFDQASARQARRNRMLRPKPRGVPHDRGWKREDLYERGLPG